MYWYAKHRVKVNLWEGARNELDSMLKDDTELMILQNYDQSGGAYHFKNDNLFRYIVAEHTQLGSEPWVCALCIAKGCKKHPSPFSLTCLDHDPSKVTEIQISNSSDEEITVDDGAQLSLPTECDRAENVRTTNDKEVSASVARSAVNVKDLLQKYGITECFVKLEECRNQVAPRPQLISEDAIDDQSFDCDIGWTANTDSQSTTLGLSLTQRMDSPDPFLASNVQNSEKSIPNPDSEVHRLELMQSCIENEVSGEFSVFYDSFSEASERTNCDM